MSKVEHVGIAGVGMYVPEKRLTNADLEKMVETSDEWITTRSGIKERRIVAPDEATSDIASNAGRKVCRGYARSRLYWVLDSRSRHSSEVRQLYLYRCPRSRLKTRPVEQK